MRVETKQEVIELIRNNRDRFARFGVSEVGLFGSFVREEQTEESDVDLLVNLSDRSLENFCNLLDFSESLFERSVDIISENSITPINGRVICREVEYVYANAESVPVVRCIRTSSFLRKPERFAFADDELRRMPLPKREVDSYI